MLSYQKHNSGIPILLVHGFCENGKVWNNLLQHLPAEYQYIIPDLPGFGNAEAVENISMEFYADYLKQIADKEKLDKFIIIGHSMGGYISLELAHKYPHRINGFGLFHSHAYADNEEQKTTRFKSIEFILKHGAREYINEFTNKLFNSNTPKSIREAHVNAIVDTPGEGLINGLKAMAERRDNTEVLKNITVPVLFIFGRHDSLMPPDSMLAQCKLPAISQVDILENSAHMGMLEEAERSAGIIKEYLAMVHFDFTSRGQ